MKRPTYDWSTYNTQVILWQKLKFLLGDFWVFRYSQGTRRGKNWVFIVYHWIWRPYCGFLSGRSLNMNEIRIFHILWKIFKSLLEALKMLLNDENVILPVTFFAFWAIFIFHILWPTTQKSTRRSPNSMINYKTQFLPLLDPCEYLKIQKSPNENLIFAIKWHVDDHCIVPQCLFAWPLHNIF